MVFRSILMRAIFGGFLNRPQYWFATSLLTFLKFVLFFRSSKPRGSPPALTQMGHPRPSACFLYFYITLHYIPYLHCITLHYITYHTYITLHYLTLHYITVHYITLHYITVHYITLHCITYHYHTIPYPTYIHNYITFTLHYITLRYITLHYNTLHTIHTLHYIT